MVDDREFDGGPVDTRRISDSRALWFKSQPTRPAWSKAKVSTTVFWHLWRTRQWPYMHVENGDLCYLVSAGGSDAEVFAEVLIDHLVRKKYYGGHDVPGTTWWPAWRRRTYSRSPSEGS